MKYLILLFASGFGSGYLPRMPGTVGSIVALLIAWLIPLELWHICLLVFAGVYICSQGERISGKHDNPIIVFDEFCGIFIAVWQLSSFKLFLVAFILFRFFDIVKPFPINKLQDLPRGWGVMADDIAAGLVTRLILMLVI